jgi:hypothetical protein
MPLMFVNIFLIFLNGGCFYVRCVAFPCAYQALPCVPRKYTYGMDLYTRGMDTPVYFPLPKWQVGGGILKKPVCFL